MILVLAAASCGGETRGDNVDLDAPVVAEALESIDAATVERHVRVLAHDSLMGRAPGTPGFAGAARYVEETLRDLGLQPAGGNGTTRTSTATERW